jgi:hypothetical protein
LLGLTFWTDIPAEHDHHDRVVCGRLQPPLLLWLELLLLLLMADLCDAGLSGPAHPEHCAWSSQPAASQQQGSQELQS